jgi:DNA-binding PadR family transcriptional regulator
MALRHAVLAALLDGSASGYELAKWFDTTVAHYWHATATQIYQELSRLEREGYVSGVEVTQRDRPNKRVMTITDKGLAELDRFAAETSRPEAFKNDLAVKVRVADVVDPEALLADLRHALDLCHQKLSFYRQNEQLLLKGRSHDTFVATARRVGPYLTLRRGIRYEQENIDWLVETIAVLSERASRRSRTKALT